MNSWRAFITHARMNDEDETSGVLIQSPTKSEFNLKYFLKKFDFFYKLCFIYYNDYYADYYFVLFIIFFKIIIIFKKSNLNPLCSNFNFQLFCFLKTL